MALRNVGQAERWIAAGLFALGGALWIVREAPASPSRAVRPEVKVTPREAREIELGRRLFFEPTVSAVGKNSCGSCHDPEHGFADPARQSRDDFSLTPRHSQTVVDVDTAMAMHWDGGIADLGEIVNRRMSSPDGGGYDGRVEVETTELEDLKAATAAVRRDLGADVGVAHVATAFRAIRFRFGSDDPSRFQERYGEALAALGTPGGNDQPREAIAAYVKSLRSSASAFDRHAAGEEGALSESARRGLTLFEGRARCAECHRLEDGGEWPLLRDGKYHNTGLSWIGAEKAESGLSKGLTKISRGLGLAATKGDPGRGASDDAKGMLRAFKTPSLRDVAARPPYMHDGSLATLTEVVKHYAAGCGNDPQRDPLVKRGFKASDQEVADLVAFLESLTSDERPGLAAEAWKHRAARTQLTFVDATGVPLPGFEVTLSPAGDRAFRGAVRPEPVVLRTDAAGRLEFEPTPCTHVRISLPQGLEPRGSPLVPDTCRSARIVVPVLGRVRLALAVPAGVEAPEELRAYPAVDPDDGTHAIDRPATARRTSRVATAQPQVFVRAARTPEDGAAVAYEAWVSDDERKVVFRLPGQQAPQEIELRTGGTMLVEVVKG